MLPEPLKSDIVGSLISRAAFALFICESNSTGTFKSCARIFVRRDLYGSRQLVDFELKRVGILGVTHEFVNSREQSNDD